MSSHPTPNLSYAILDCCFIPIIAGFFLTRYWKIDPDRLGLKLRTYDDPINRRGLFNGGENMVHATLLCQKLKQAQEN